MIMEYDSYLEQLSIENRQIIFDYLAYYSRMEYALKKCNFTQRRDNGVSANWECFIKNIKNNFNKEQTEELNIAVDYLLRNPPLAQMLDKEDNYIFDKHDSTLVGPIPLRLYHCLRIVRNNLFHGGKFPGNPVSDVARDTDLLKYCKIVLTEFILIDGAINSTFIETA